MHEPSHHQSRPRRRIGRIGILLVAITLLTPGVASATIGPAVHSYTKNLYASSGVRFQDPDYTACVAASTVMMLNMIAASGTGGESFRWVPSTSAATQGWVLRWERGHQTQVTSHPGVDPHGWRNGLNSFGWGVFTVPELMVYDDFSFTSYTAAVKATVMAIARYDKPVGILGWAGGHAQVVTGYTVVGQDPAVSADFEVWEVYLTDPLRRNARINARIPDETFRAGTTITRFRPYRFKDSPKDDPYTAGTRASYKEWYGRWVIVAPVR